jgi:tRNA dimethylallyltransferase
LVQVVAGPTASGKSAAAMALAASALADGRPSLLINADSAQLYNHLPILTNQPSEADQAAVPHVLLAFLSPTADYSVGLWRQDAMAAIDRAVAAGQQPIVVGGTGLYLKALMQGLAVMPPILPAVRQQGLTLLEGGEEPALRDALAAHDPLSAQQIRPRDFVRLLRAYEVVVASGRPIHAWHADPLPPPPYRFVVTKLLPDRADLYDRINRRFAAMVAAGAVAEVADYLQRYTDPPASALKVLGFGQLRAHLAGKLSLAQAIDSAATATRHYAKRQYTWLRHQMMD